MQQWHQLEFKIKEESYVLVEEYLFDNFAGSVTKISKANNLSLITVLYDNNCDIDTIKTNLISAFKTSIFENMTYKVIKNKQWESSWINDYKPVQIGNEIVVYPDWKEPPSDNKIYILVDPSIVFGCGNHETTKMCLEWLENNVTKNMDVLDYGCGTGILTIAAIKLGASYSEGVDIDPDSIKSSIKNAKTNNVLQMTNFSNKASNKEFDVIVANVFSNVIISLVDTLLSRLKYNGKIILSGILEDQVKQVQEVFIKQGVIFTKPKQLGQWFLLDGVKK